MTVAVVAMLADVPQADPIGDVPNVVGLTRAEAEVAVGASGHAMEIAHAPLRPDDVVLRQSPPAGVTLPGVPVRVTFVATDELGRSQSVGADQARPAILLARDRAQAARGGPWTVVELLPIHPDDTKGTAACQPVCLSVLLNAHDAGASVFVDFRGAPVAGGDVSILGRHSPSILYGTRELVAAALADPLVQAELPGAVSGDVVGGGALGPPCELPTGESVCVTILVEPQPGSGPVLIYLNVVTLELRLQKVSDE